ncbi:MAG: CaiB/BaiF CoA transferase family protein [Thermaurantiacus sp.]
MSTQNQSSTQRGPLAGVTIVDLTRVLAGPYCTMVLADLGARVIKVEAPGQGDDARAIGPFVAGESAYFASVNRGKESIALDLKSEADRAILTDLLARADVLVENFRPGALARMGFGWPMLSAHFPRLVLASASGFGQTGPWASRAAYDIIVQALGGLMSVTGPAGGPPVRVGTSIGDITAGLFTAIGILAALNDRARTGLGAHVDVAMFDCQLAILENAIARFAATGTDPGPLGTRHPSITPFQAFRAADGMLVIAAGNDTLWAALCRALGAPHLAADPRFATNPARSEHAGALEAELDTILQTRPVAEWLPLLEAEGVPAGPVNRVSQALASPQVTARTMLVESALPGGVPLKVAGNPVKLSTHSDSATRPPAPALDEHRPAILAELGRA